MIPKSSNLVQVIMTLGYLEVTWSWDERSKVKVTEVISAFFTLIVGT